jgi:hypothetical protein
LTESSTDADFEAKFIVHMTEDTCVGPDQWQEGIGQNREEWRCNPTCQKANMW